MSGHYYQPPVTSGEQFYNFDDPFDLPHTTSTGSSLTAYATESYQSLAAQHGQLYTEYSQLYQAPPQAQQYQFQMPVQQQQRLHGQQWSQLLNNPIDASTYRPTAVFPQYADAVNFVPEALPATLSRTSPAHLSPEASRPRASRATSVAESVASSVLSSHTEFSRGNSPSATEMSKWGRRNSQGSWSCAYPGCTSKSRFNRGCDLRKHYKRHTKSLYCRHDGCPQSREGGFSSKKDRARHEAKHNPMIVCEWEGCERLFSRQDNMVSVTAYGEGAYAYGYTEGSCQACPQARTMNYTWQTIEEKPRTRGIRDMKPTVGVTI